MRALRMKSAYALATGPKPQPPRLHALLKHRLRALLRLRLRAARLQCPIGIRRRPKRLARKWLNRTNRPPQTDTYRSRFADYPTGAAQASVAAESAKVQDEAAALRSLRLLSRLFLNRLLPPLRPHVFAAFGRVRCGWIQEIEAPKPSADIYAVRLLSLLPSNPQSGGQSCAGTCSGESAHSIRN